MTPAERLANKVAEKKQKQTSTKNQVVICHIKAKRERLGLTVKDMAQHFGVGIQTIYQMEYGKYSPSMKWLRKLEDFFGCTHRELWEPLTEDNTTPPTPQLGELS